MSATWMGVEPEPPKADFATCCLCGGPRPEGLHYLCSSCSDASVDLALRIEVAVAAMRERRVCAPVERGEGA